MPSRFFDLMIDPNVDMVGVVRRFATDFCARIVPDPAITSRIGLAVHELFENTVRYSTDSRSRLLLEISPDDSSVQVCVENHTVPSHIAVLHRIFTDIGAATDRSSYYMQVIRSNAKRVEESGLGIARVFAEAEMTMRLEQKGDLVSIYARAAINRSQA